jgi:hypothetical protein
MKRKRGKAVAWLITWEWIGNHAEVENKVAAVLRWRLHPKIVREIVEALYANRYSLSERLAVAEHNGRNNPYPARYGDINGAPWEARIYCGHNPHLYARLVDNLRVEIDENGEEKLNWKERPIPEHIQKMLKEGRRLP